MLEVEYRGLIVEDRFEKLRKILTDIAGKAEEDHRDTMFFMIPNCTLKVTRMVSKRSAKIAFKSGDIVRSIAQHEIEIPIPQDSYEDMIAIFKSLGFTQTQATHQIRYNFSIEGCDLSLKWSKDWGYHFEIDCVVASASEIAEAQTKLLKTLNGLQLTPMTEQEFEEFRRRIDAQHNSSQVAL